MQLDIELTKNDFWSFTNTVASGQLGDHRNAVFLLNVVVWIAISYTGIHLFRTGQDLDYTAAQWLFGPGAIVFLVFAANYSHRRCSRSIFSPLLSSYVLGPKTYVFTADHIEASGEKTFSRFIWGAIMKVVNTDTHIFLVLDSNAALIIPKRVFESDELLGKFQEQVAEWTADAGRTGT